MKQLMTFLIFAISMSAHAHSLEKSRSNCRLISSKRDRSLSLNEAKYTFEFIISFESAPSTIKYSMDGVEGTVTLTDRKFSISATPGNHTFQFFYSSNHYEVYTDSLKIKGGHHSLYEIQMERSDMMQVIDKPVIYLYPEVETAVEVKLDIVGTPTFYYPAYTDSWKFIAMPSGDLIFGDDTYNYLFWEASTRTGITPKQSESGFFVEGKNVTTFLEEKLNEAGFTSKERADFITYWGPRLAQNELNFVHFEFNESCDQFATLNISPRPAHVNRIYMLWGAVQAKFPIVEQKIKQINRTGFDVLEWGGQQTHIRQGVGLQAK